MKRYTILGVLLLLFVFVALNSSFADIKEEDFVGYWLLDDGKGKEAKDLSGNNYDGQITNGKWVKGQVDGGLEFDGTSTFIEVEHHEDFNLTDSLTIAAWARIDAIPMDHIGIPRKEAEYVLHPTSAGGDGFNLRFYIGIGGWQPPVISDTVVKYGEWHYLAGTYDGKELKVFIDGKVDKAQNQAGDIVATTAPLRWSNDCCGGRMLEGILDELAILNRALDEAEMTQMMEGILTALAVSPTGKLAVSWGSIKDAK